MISGPNSQLSSLNLIPVGYEFNVWTACNILSRVTDMHIVKRWWSVNAVRIEHIRAVPKTSKEELTVLEVLYFAFALPRKKVAYSLHERKL